MFFKSVYEWLLNTFIRINPYIKALIIVILLTVALWFIYKGFAKSNAKSGDKKKDFGIAYFIIAGIFVFFAALMTVL